MLIHRAVWHESHVLDSIPLTKCHELVIRLEGDAVPPAVVPRGKICQDRFALVEVRVRCAVLRELPKQGVILA
ncbi:hypothetical protein D3C72_1817380 [compost metagenome]